MISINEKAQTILGLPEAADLKTVNETKIVHEGRTRDFKEVA